jgi:NAD(P)-dependent dehydrogenase (short-subunit alcohol dehydrogenase family)
VARSREGSADFGGQVAVVTGASSGIGAELSRQLAAAGAKVGMMALADPALDAVAKTIRDRGGVAATVGVDVTHREAVHAALSQLTRELGPIDVLILNAGIGRVTAVESFSAEAVEQMVRVNLLGVAYAIEAALPSMIERGRGHVVGVSSLSSYRGQPVFSGYCASKAGVATLLEGLRIELRPYGIMVTTVRPGFVRTPINAAFKSPRFMIEVGPAGRLILQGIKERRAEINFPWQSALLMGLTRWLPNDVYDRLAARVISPLKKDLETGQ